MNIIFKQVFLLFFLPSILFSSPIKKYKIVIDPGHGGAYQSPKEYYGDKFDPITEKYLEFYKNGGTSRDGKFTEMQVVLDLGKEVKKILDLTNSEEGFIKFKKYIKNFSDVDNPEWIKIQSVMTRNDTYKDKKYREKVDKNHDYRMYDFYEFGKEQKVDKAKFVKGRLSQINSETPYLVLSLHINDIGGYRGRETGMGVVLTPSYDTFDKLRKISEGTLSKEEFLDSDWYDWMTFQAGWSKLENAMADAWIYYNGYWPIKNGSESDLKRFEGFRQNMVTWRYKDDKDWLKKVGKPGSYSYKHKDFKAVGKFWDRERNKFEKMRREDGLEGFGGDNHYAGAEILRFIQYGMRLKSENPEKELYKEPGKILPPFISTYSLPTFINAISAYIELGDINSERDMYFVVKHKKKMAICIAVGIYSLFQSLEVRKNEFPYTPRGEKIDFNKYITPEGENYFKQVVND